MMHTMHHGITVITFLNVINIKSDKFTIVHDIFYNKESVWRTLPLEYFTEVETHLHHSTLRFPGLELYVHLNVGHKIGVAENLGSVLHSQTHNSHGIFA